MQELTQQQELRLEVLRLVLHDTAAAQLAIKFIEDENLKLELFKDQWQLSQAESKPVARALKAIQSATEALLLFKEKEDK